MAALGSQSIASSYEQLLHVDSDGGGNSTTHVSVKDGDNGTTFGFTIASDALMMSSTNRLEFGDTGTYIHQSADGVLDLVSDTEIEINATTIDMNGALDVSGNAQLSGTVTVGADGSGTDVIFYSGTAGDNLTWDASDEKLIITGTNGTTALDVADGNVSITDDLAVDGTANLDNTDIEGTLAVDGATISLDATTSFNIDNSNTSNGITVGTATSGVPISIGHTTSETTVNDNLVVTGDIDLAGSIDCDGTANLDIVDIDGAVNIGDNVTLSGSSASRYYFLNSGADGGVWQEGDFALRLGTNDTQRMRISGGGSVYINDDANANVTTGLTINMGANDDQILAFKSSDVAHGRTSYAETDTYANFNKASGANGGLFITSIMEDGAVDTSMQIVATGGQASTSAAHNEAGLVVIRVEEHDGSNGLANVASGGNVFSVRAQVGDATRTVFNVTEAGNISYDGSDAGAFDYAEMFEWKDGNPDNEERHGYSVVLDGDKIRKAEDGETPIGIVSVKPAICGDNPNGWYKTFKMDEWGRNIDKEVKAVKFEIQHELEPATYYEEGDELPEGKKVGDEKTAAVYTTKEKHYRGDAIPDDLPDDAEHYTILQRQHSDEYDDSQSYTMRNKRKEWSPVGLMGKLRMHKGQPTASSWIKMKDEGNDIEMWLVK